MGFNYSFSRNVAYWWALLQIRRARADPVVTLARKDTHNSAHSQQVVARACETEHQFTRGATAASFSHGMCATVQSTAATRPQPPSSSDPSGTAQ